MSEVVAYLAPSPWATIDQQRALALKVVSDERFIRVDAPKSKKAALSRDQRDFVLAHMLRAENPDGKPDILWVHDFVVLGDSQAEAQKIWRALDGLGIPLLVHRDQLGPDVPGTQYLLRYERAMRRAGPYWRRKAEAAGRGKPSHKAAPSGRKRSLTPAQIEDIAHMFDVQMMTWREIAAKLAERGIEVSAPTIRREYRLLKRGAGQT